MKIANYHKKQYAHDSTKNLIFGNFPNNTIAIKNENIDFWKWLRENKQFHIDIQ